MEKKGRRRRGAMADINVTPLVDVMLVLLIVFMVAAPMMTQGLEVDLPEASTNPLPQMENPLVVTIQKDGAIYLDKEKVPESSLLLTQLKDMPAEQKKSPIYLHADKSLSYETVMRALSDLHKMGFEKPCLVNTLPKHAEN